MAHFVRDSCPRATGLSSASVKITPEIFRNENIDLTVTLRISRTFSLSKLYISGWIDMDANLGEDILDQV